MRISGTQNLSDLRRALLNNPSLCLKCGFDPLHLPPVERFSSFELTKPANVSKGELLIAIVKTLKEHIKAFRQALITDGAYDKESNLKFIVQELKAKPVAARNLCWEKHKEHKLSRKGMSICIAGLEMICWGRFCDRGRVRLKYVCPIINSKSYREKYYFCPWNHPKFTEGKGY